MANLNYLDFGLRIEQHGSGYRARVSQSPIGEHAHVDFELPAGVAAKVLFAPDSGQRRHLLDPTASMQKSWPKEFGRLLLKRFFGMRC